MNTPTHTGEDRPEGRRGFLQRVFGAIAGAVAFASVTPRGAAAGTDMQPDPHAKSQTQGTNEIEPYLGQIAIASFNFAPKGWALCSGQLLAISQNAALFSLLGTTYGGNGITTFALPNLNGRVPVGAGTDGTVQQIALGEAGGATRHTLSLDQLPSHTHTVAANAGSGTAASPVNAYFAASPEGSLQYAPTANAQGAGTTTGNQGGTSSHNNMQPYLGLTFIIALSGIYPSHP